LNYNQQTAELVAADAGATGGGSSKLGKSNYVHMEI
jgi:hypothetical protein